MAVIPWLQNRSPGFRDLGPVDFDGILQFVLAWSYFEAEVLAAEASARSIKIRVGRRRGRIKLDASQACLAYFRDRYFPAGVESHYFAHLRLRDNDDPALVRRVLDGSSDDPEEVLAALLIVVYRFRNNLFHGIKWAYELRGQRENFSQSNALLMLATEQLL